MSAGTEFYKGIQELHGKSPGARRALRELKRKEAESRNAQTPEHRRRAVREGRMSA